MTVIIVISIHDECHQKVNREKGVSGLPFHYAWVVAAVTFLTMLATAGAVGAPGVFIVPLEQEFGWSKAEISSALAVRFGLYGLLGSFSAALMQRFGIRRMMLIALAICAGGMLASLGMRHLWQLVILWGVVIGVGTGLIAMVLGATVATRWFSARRGFVVGLLAASTATGQLLFLPLLASLTAHWGWRTALSFVVTMLGLAAVAVAALMRDHPADVGLPAYGERAVVKPAAQTASLREVLLTPWRVLGEAVRVRAFWPLFAGFFICGASTNGLIQTHFISMCGDYGLAAFSAASLLATMGVFDFFGTIGSGWLSDRFDNRWLLFGYYGLRGLSLIYLPTSDFSPRSLTLFTVFYGLDWIATVPPTVKLTAQQFGPARAGVVFGWIFAGHQLGAATAAYGGGLIRTLYASYAPAFEASGALCLLAAILALLLIKRPAPIPAPAL